MFFGQKLHKLEKHMIQVIKKRKKKKKKNLMILILIQLIEEKQLD